MSRLNIRIVSIACLSLLSASAATAVTPTRYAVTPIGHLGGGESIAYGINNDGQVVGRSSIGPTPTRGFDGVTHAFLWTVAGGIQDLGALEGGLGNSMALAVNSAGSVVGTSFSNTHYRAFLWTSGKGMMSLPNLGGSYSVALAINDSGVIAGEANILVQHEISPGVFEWVDGPEHAVVWTPDGQIHDIGAITGSDHISVARGINRWGDVVGLSQVVGGFPRAIMWPHDGGFIDIGTTGGHGADAYAINDLGQIVGNSSDVSGATGQSFLYTPGAGMQVLDLGTSGSALGINGHGVVVGTGGHPFYGYGVRAFVYERDLGFVLNEHTEPTIGVSSARAINDSGQIVADANHTGSALPYYFATYLLTPICEEPVILGGRPTPAAACPGADVSLSVFVNSSEPIGYPLSYTWRRNEAPISPTNNPSAATPMLTIAQAASSDSGVYDCIVSNACGSAMSDPATLLVGGASPSLFWDVGDDWSDATNPNGVWSFNDASSSPLPSYYPFPGNAFPPDQHLWSPGGGLPAWCKVSVPLTQALAGTVQIGDVLVISGPARGNVTWTSPLSGTVRVSGAVWNTRAMGGAETWVLRLNRSSGTRAQLSGGAISGGDVPGITPTSRDAPMALATGSGGASALTNIVVSTGDVLELEFGAILGVSFDFVGVKFQVTAGIGPGSPPNCAGDANGDAEVDFRDLNIILSDFGRADSCLIGDVDADGDCDFIDLNIVLSAFGTAC